MKKRTNLRKTQSTDKGGKQKIDNLVEGVYIVPIAMDAISLVMDAMSLVVGM